MAIGLSVRCFILLAYFACCECFFFHCPPCDLVDCPELPCDPSLQVLDPECGCCATCAKADAESCGGLTNDQCAPSSTCVYRLGLIMGENRTGICEPAQCKRTHCNYRQYCGYWEYIGNVKYVCLCRPFKCDGKYNPVCGYDGMTYPSICKLQRAECTLQDYIGIKHMGPCAPTPAPPTGDAYSVKTNAIPTTPENVDDFFDQVVDHPQPKIEIPIHRGCIYKGSEYALNSRTKLDPCTYFYCEADGNSLLLKVPGCPDGPIDPDYGVTLPPVHGGWSEWQETVCIGTCHGANMTLQRYCTNPAPRYEGNNCSGPSEKVVKCIPDFCNYTCEYDEWSEWGPCSVTCGPGTQIRRRELINNITDLEANNCDLVETRQCHIVETCPTSCQRVQLGKEKMIDANGCETVVEWPVYECVGPCSGEEECCAVSRRRPRRPAVQCPGLDWYVQSRIDLIDECSCSDRRRDCPLTPS